MVRTMSTTELKGGGNCTERQEDYFQTKNLLWGEILPIFAKMDSPGLWWGAYKEGNIILSITVLTDFFVEWNVYLLDMVEVIPNNTEQLFSRCFTSTIFFHALTCFFILHMLSGTHTSYLVDFYNIFILKTRKETNLLNMRKNT